MKPSPRGFLPDFSRYLSDDYPIVDAYKNSTLISKLCRLLSELPVAVNPARELQQKGCCKKLEKFTPKDKHEKSFIEKCSFQEGQLYYAAFGDCSYRIVFGINSSERIAYFFALDTKHSIRKG